MKGYTVRVVTDARPTDDELWDGLIDALVPFHAAVGAPEDFVEATMSVDVPDGPEGCGLAVTIGVQAVLAALAALGVPAEMRHAEVSPEEEAQTGTVGGGR
ncbi:hypothetical protein [Pseudonocardia sp. T1-2H]|uniref:hypothetical protein n=1 Tax=Pseudonocardia sp. T1-2H TaxID=3128899 RepID=UPI003100B446